MNRGIAFVGAAAVGLVVSVISAVPASADDFTICPSGMTGVATEDTRCAFAENVRAAWGAQPGTAITAYSPVTSQSYVMQCTPTTTNTWPVAQRCVGSNSYGVVLIVFIATPAGGAGATGTQGAPQQAGAGVDSPSLPSVNGPNIGCTWVNGYTKKNGTYVSGYLRC